jgi:nitrogen fixation protein FixH
MNQVMTLVRLRWIPSLFVLGFLVVIAVNAVLIINAVGSFSGLVVEHPYKKGAEYTRMQQKLADQKALHWQYRMVAEPQPDGRTKLTLMWQDQAGQALAGLDVSVECSRPVENVPAIKARLIERGAGRYEAILALPRAGLWDLRFNAAQADRSFIAVERLQVP